LSYVELHCRSAFSLLDGASTPETLAACAADLGLASLAITDLDDLGGVVRFARAAAETGVRPIFGAELTLDRGGTVVLLCEGLEGYENLSHLVTEARMGRPRGEPAIGIERLAARHRGLVCLTGGRDGAVDRAWQTHGEPAARELTGSLAEIYPGRLYVEVQDHSLSEDIRRIRGRLELAHRLALPWLVAGDVRHARARDKPTHDALVCLKHRLTLDEAGDRLFPNDARRLASPTEMARRWQSAPVGLLRTLEVDERCRFPPTRFLPARTTPTRSSRPAFARACGRVTTESRTPTSDRYGTSSMSSGTSASRGTS
jgi:error-prone DNA polymerase